MCQPGFSRSPESEQVSPSTSHPRSCFTCNRKKIRCDKKHPCSACARAGKGCAYPSSGPRMRRTKKTIMEEMASRISSLEKSLAKSRGQSHLTQPTTLDSKTTSMVPRTQHGKAGEVSREDILVQKGSSSQYFNEVLLSRVLEEVSLASIHCMLQYVGTIASPTKKRAWRCALGETDGYQQAHPFRQKDSSLFNESTPTRTLNHGLMAWQSSVGDMFFPVRWLINCSRDG